mmetsp:Transcript_13011/g.19200  ORF Transcript_13011/g.19200 Transcript_13011/m.19200 type:complete len:444 (-) Transcript_13011:378-1709(-)
MACAQCVQCTFEIFMYMVEVRLVSQSESPAASASALSFRPCEGLLQHFFQRPPPVLLGGPPASSLSPGLGDDGQCGPSSEPGPAADAGLAVGHHTHEEGDDEREDAPQQLAQLDGGVQRHDVAAAVCGQARLLLAQALGVVALVAVLVVLQHPLQDLGALVLLRLRHAFRAEGLAQLRVHDDALGGGVELLHVAAGGREPVLAVFHQVTRASLLNDAGHPRGQCLQGDVPKGLHVAGEQQAVGAGVGHTQLLPAQPPRHPHILQRLHLRLERALPHDQPLEGHPLLRQPPGHVHPDLRPLLLHQAPHPQQHHFLRPDAVPAAELLAAPGWVKNLHVHSASPYFHARDLVKPLILQLRADKGSRHEELRHVGVEVLEVVHDRRPQPPLHVVVLHVVAVVAVPRRKVRDALGDGKLHPVHSYEIWNSEVANRRLEIEDFFRCIRI